MDYKSKERLTVELLLGHRDKEFITKKCLIGNLERLSMTVEPITFE